jgi:hypothetical protein
VKGCDQLWLKPSENQKNYRRNNYFFFGDAEVDGFAAGALAGAAADPFAGDVAAPLAGDAAAPLAGDVAGALSGACCNGCCAGAGVGLGLATGAAGADCNTEREPLNDCKPSASASSMNAAAAPIVIFAKRLAVPRGPNAVLDNVLENNAPASALPGCSNTTTIRITLERMNSP